MSILFIRTQCPEIHGQLVIQLAILTGISCFQTCLKSVGPYLSLDGVHSSSADFTLVAISFISFFAVWTVKTGPDLHHDLNKLYTKAATNQAQAHGSQLKSNVFARVNSSLLSKIFNNYAIPVMHEINHLEQADVQDVPVPQASMRSQVILSNTSDFGQNGSNQGFSRHFGPTTELLWTVWYPQKQILLISRTGILHEASLTCISHWLHASDCTIDLLTTLLFPSDSLDIGQQSF